jgi:anaerobic magnesium-protoporphyrin IX monomethyl ester cyclase
MIDVCLIYLPKPFLRDPDAQAPLGLMYLAASLESRNRTVTIENYAPFNDAEAINHLPPAKLYGITVTSLEVLQANRFSGKIKRKYPDAKIVLGGPGVYATEYINFNVIDSACFGDGEYTIHDILHDAENNTLKQKYFGEIVENLDSLPLPSRHLLKDKQGGKIFAYGKNYTGEDASTIIVSSRGCAFQCAFCSAPRLTHNKKLRFRSPEEVAREMRHVKNTYGIKQFRFSDDMFTATKKRTLELCDAIGPENVYWRISCRVKPLDSEMLDAMYQAGCRELSFGIESFDDNVLSGLHKKSTSIDNINALELSAKHGFSTRILLMIRTPFQTPETIEHNKYWLSHVPFSIIACTAFIPIPGCDIWYNPDKYNIEILNRDLDLYNFYMYGRGGRRTIDPIIKIKSRDLYEFHRESEDFRDWLETDLKKINKG